MAIQMRRGPLAKYNKNKMLAGEWGISIDTDTNDQKAMIAFAPGVDKEVMFVDDFNGVIAESIDIATEEAEAWAHGNSFHVNDYASGDGSTRSFTLAETPSSIIGVYINEEPVSNYTLSGNTITFTTAPESGSNNIRIYYTVNNSTDNAKYYKEQAASSASAASGSNEAAWVAYNSARQEATLSKSYAVGGTGSRSGENTDNAKYYKEQAASSASSASSSASSASSSASSAAGSASTANTKASEATTSANNALNAASTATTQAGNAEAWAVGQRNGTDVPSTDPAYQNNAKYYAENVLAAVDDELGKLVVKDGADKYLVSFNVDNAHIIATFTPYS